MITCLQSGRFLPTINSRIAALSNLDLAIPERHYFNGLRTSSEPTDGIMTSKDNASKMLTGSNDWVVWLERL